MDIMENPGRSNFDLFGDLSAGERARLDEEALTNRSAWRQPGSRAVRRRRELEEIYSKLTAAKRMKGAKSRSGPTSTYSDPAKRQS